MEDQVIAVLHGRQRNLCNLRQLTRLEAQDANDTLREVHRQQRNRTIVIHRIAQILSSYCRNRLIDRSIRIVDEIQSVALYRMPHAEQFFCLVKISMDIIR